jgi:hypothetical protein
VADHALTSATRHWLGGLLLHQLPDRAQAPPLAHKCFNLAIICGITPPFGGLFPTKG